MKLILLRNRAMELILLRKKESYEVDFVQKEREI